MLQCKTRVRARGRIGPISERVTIPLIALLFFALSAAFPLVGFTRSGTAQSTFAVAPFGANTLLEIDLRGRTLRTIATLPSMNVYQLLHANDNRDMLVFGQANSPALTWLLLRVTPAGTLTTVLNTPLLPAVPLIHPDGDGNYLITQRNPTFTDTYFLLLTGGQLTPLAIAVGLTADGFTIDPRDGRILLRGFTPQLVFGYYGFDLRTSAITTLTQPAYNIRNLGIGARAPIFRPAGADFVDLYASGPKLVGAVVRVDGRGLRTVTSFGPYTWPSDVVLADGRAHPVAFRALVYETLQQKSSRIVGLLENGTAVNVSPWITGFTTWQRNTLLRLGGRHVVFQRTAPPNNGTLSVSFPRESGRPYIAAFSLSGVTPGFSLADGRTIPLNPDVLTAVTVSAGLPGLITRNVGKLDATGRTTVNVTLNALGSVVRGTRLWASVVVLDPRASGGIAHISEPTLIELR